MRTFASFYGYTSEETLRTKTREDVCLQGKGLFGSSALIVQNPPDGVLRFWIWGQPSNIEEDEC